MKRLLLLWFCVILLLVNPLLVAFADDFSELYLYKHDETWGFVDERGEIVIPATFSAVTPFQNDVALVSYLDQFALINKQGKYVISPCCEIYEYTSAFVYAVDIGTDLAWGFYDKRSGFLSPTYEAIQLTSSYIDEQEYIAVQNNGKWGFVHRSTGNVIIPCVYDEIIEPFQNGYALVSLADHQTNDNFDSMDDYILINSNGDPVTFDGGIVPMSCPSSLGIISVSQNGLYGLADIYGCQIIAPQHNFVDSPTDDRFWYQNTAGYWGVLDESGTVIVEPSFLHNDLLYGTPPAYVNDYAVVRLTDQVVILDLVGNETVINCDPNITVGNVIDGVQMLACYDSATNLYGFCNIYGLMLTSELYENYSPLANGLITVMREGKWGVLDNKGIEILPCIYDEINLFNNSTVYVIQDSTISYISISEGKLFF